MPVPKPHNSGQWTVARFRAFIKSALRSATMRWGPINQAKKEARVDRGLYRCEGYKKRWHVVPVSIVDDKGTRRNNVYVDHIHPVIDPTIGFTTWDEVIDRMFVEKDQLQVLCKECHDRKTTDERKQRSSNV